MQRNDVRYVCGVFWRGRSETALLFKSLGACQDGWFFQPFWTEESHESGNAEEIAAVAARFDMVAPQCGVHCSVPRILGGAWPFEGRH